MTWTSSAVGSPTEHPDSETLAAFLEGRLAGEEHRAVVEHVAQCSDCYAVVADSMAVLDELEATDPLPADVRPFRTRSVRLTPPAWIAAAAVLVVALGVAWLVLRQMPRSGDVYAMTSEEWLAPLAEAGVLGEAAGELWGEAPESLGLGGAGSGLRFQLGVRLVDAQAALAGGSEDARAAALEEVAALLNRMPETDLSGAADDLLRAPTPESLAALERRLATEVPTVPVAFGRYAEASRLAAAAGAEEFFTREESRQALEEFLAADRLVLVRDDLEGIRTMIQGDGVRDLAELERLWSEVILTMETAP